MIPVGLGELVASVSIDTSAIDRGAAIASSKIERFSDRLKARGLSSIVIGTSIAAPLGLAIRQAAEFDRQMRMVSTMLKDDSLMAGFTSGIERMSTQFGESTDTLAHGLYEILSAAIPAEQAMGLLDVAVRAARGGMTDTATSVDALTTVLNSYGLAAAKAGDLSDWFFAVVERGKMTYEEMAQHIGMVATTAHTANVSLDELGAALSTMTRVGLKTDNAVTSLNSIISAFLKPTDEAAQYARTLGFEMSSATLKAIGLKGVFDRLKALPPDAISNLFPDVRGLRGVLPALQNMAGFEDDLAAMANRAGVAEAAFKKMAGGLYFSLSTVKTAFIAVQVAIAEGLAPSVVKLAETFVTASRWVAEFIRQNQWLVLSVAVAGFSLIGTGVIMLGVVASSWIAIRAVESLISTFKVLAALATLAVSPIGLLVATIAVVGAVLVNVNGVGNTFIERLTSIANTIWNTVQPALLYMKDTTVEAFDVMLFSIRNWATIGELMLTAWAHGAVSAFNTVVWAIQQIPSILVWVADNWKTLLWDMWNLIKTFATNVWTNLKNLWTAITNWDFSSFQWTGLTEGFRSALTSLPEIADRELGPLEKKLAKRLGELETELGTAWGEHLASKMVQPVEAAAKAADKAVAQAKKEMPAFDEITSAAETRPALAPLAERGSAEAYNSIVHQENSEKTTAKNTGGILAEMKILNKAVAAGLAPAPVVDLGLG